MKGQPNDNIMLKDDWTERCVFKEDMCIGIYSHRSVCVLYSLLQASDMKLNAKKERRLLVLVEDWLIVYS